MIVIAAALVLTFPHAFALAPKLEDASQAGTSQRATDLRRLASEKAQKGDYAGASWLLGKARELFLRTPDLAPDIRSCVLADLGDAYEHLGAWPEAVAVFNEGIAADDKAYGPRDSRTAYMQVRLGAAELIMGRFPSAETRLRNALEVQQEAPFCRRSEVALALSNLAMVDLNFGRTAVAERTASRAVEVMQAAGAESADYALILSLLSGVYVIEGKGARALPLVRRAISIMEQQGSRDDVRIAPMLVERGLIEAADQKFQIAEEDMHRAIEILNIGRDSNPNADWPRIQLAGVYMAEGKVDQADSILPATVDRQRSVLSGRRLAFCLRELARLRAMQKRYREASSLYRETLSTLGALKPGKENREPGEKQIRSLDREASSLLESAGFSQN